MLLQQDRLGSSILRFIGSASYELQTLRENVPRHILFK